MKIKLLATIITTLICILLIIVFLSYNYLYGSVEYPESFIYIGKTINTSELYNTDKFTWYEYNTINNYSNNPARINDKYEWDYQIYKNNNSPHYRISHIYYNSSGYNLTQINDFYWDTTGSKIIDVQLRSYENNELKNTAYNIDGSYTYNKTIVGLPYGFNIAPKGTEMLAIDNRSYDCKKYYLPSQNINGAGSVPTIFWFNDSVPVPLKIYGVNENITSELVGWG